MSITAGLADGDPCCVAPPGPVSAMVTGLGSERAYQSPAPPSTATSTTISPAISPRESVSRRSRNGMRATLGARHDVRSETDHFSEKFQRVTRFTSLGARTISFATSRSPIARCAFSEA